MKFQQAAPGDATTATLVIDNIGMLVTSMGVGAVRGREMDSLLKTPSAAIAVNGESIVAAGPRRNVLNEIQTIHSTQFVDARGMAVVPGLVDCHTHLIYAGDRADDLSLIHIS